MESSNGKKQQNMQTKLTNRHFVLNGHQICKMCMTYMAILLLCNAWPTHYGHVRVSVVYRSIDRSINSNDDDGGGSGGSNSDTLQKLPLQLLRVIIYYSPALFRTLNCVRCRHRKTHKEVTTKN